MVRSVGFNPGAWKTAWALSPAVIVVLFAFILWTPDALAQQDVRAVRSAYVYNLTKYVTWPQPKHALRIGVIGDAATGAAVKAILEGKSSDGRSIHVLLNPSDSSISGCDIVYITSTETSAANHVLPLISGLPILTVGDESRFPLHGGMVGFVRLGDRVEIEVNLETVSGAGLKMSSRLLDLATVVSQKGVVK